MNLIKMEERRTETPPPNIMLPMKKQENKVANIDKKRLLHSQKEGEFVGEIFNGKVLMQTPFPGYIEELREFYTDKIDKIHLKDIASFYYQGLAEIKNVKIENLNKGILEFSTCEDSLCFINNCENIKMKNGSLQGKISFSSLKETKIDGVDFINGEVYINDSNIKFNNIKFKDCKIILKNCQIKITNSKFVRCKIESVENKIVFSSCLVKNTSLNEKSDKTEIEDCTFSQNEEVKLSKCDVNINSLNIFSREEGNYLIEQSTGNIDYLSNVAIFKVKNSPNLVDYTKKVFYYSGEGSIPLYTRKLVIEKEIDDIINVPNKTNLVVSLLNKNIKVKKEEKIIQLRPFEMKDLV